MQSNNTKELTQKNRYIPRGILKKVSEQFGVSPLYVSLVKNGKRNNIKILEAVAFELEQYNKLKSSLIKKINK